MIQNIWFRHIIRLTQVNDFSWGFHSHSIHLVVDGFNTDIGRFQCYRVHSLVTWHESNGFPPLIPLSQSEGRVTLAEMFRGKASASIEVPSPSKIIQMEVFFLEIMGKC